MSTKTVDKAPRILQSYLLQASVCGTSESVPEWFNESPNQGLFFSGVILCHSSSHFVTTLWVRFDVTLQIPEFFV